ncbi:AAA family ATPase [Mycobacterium sp. DSM 3803]|nr:AAA family ATPase [Mycobacterium sp. DSM 3803]
MTINLLDPNQYAADAVQHRQRLRSHDGEAPLRADEIAAIERQARRDAEHENRLIQSAFQMKVNHKAAMQRMAVKANATAAGKAAVAAGPLDVASADTIATLTPSWAWEYDGRGRILKGGLTLFAGRPAAGKSTAARWFAAQWTNGDLPGCWEGKPVNVCYVATEESWQHTVAPSLEAAGADMQRAFFIHRSGDPTKINALDDRDELANLMRLHNIRAVVLDPFMSSTVKGSSDVYKSNEVRELVEPWAHIAEAIDGVVLGITHLTKAARDVVAGVNGSSAFGEVARCVFGFAVDKESDDGTRIMTQAKNSAGAEGLNLAYRIGERTISMSDGGSAAMARFELIGTTDKTVGQLLSDEQNGGQKTVTEDCVTWLRGYLKVKGPTQRMELVAAGAGLGFKESAIKRAAGKLAVQIERTRTVPPQTVWSLPGRDADE